MTGAWDEVIRWLPDEVGRALHKLSPPVRDAVHEIRLRAGQAVTVSSGGQEWYLTRDGGTTAAAGGAVHCTAAGLRAVVDRACEQSLYAHENELRQGFLPAPRGCRIGIAGTAVMERGVVKAYRDITALCVRIAREHRGCAASLAAQLCDGGGVHGALICGEPSSGKTALLRDLLHEFAVRRISAAVIDERGELTGDGAVRGCDVLRGTPKAEGILQAIRCLSPRVVVFDELGTAAECEAIRAALTCGVPVIASAHCRAPTELLRRDGIPALLYSGAFEYLVQLRGAAAAGEIAAVLRVEEWVHEMAGSAADCERVRGCGCARGV